MSWNGSGTDSRGGSQPPASRPLPKRKFAPVILAAALVLVVAGIAVMLQHDGSDVPRKQATPAKAPASQAIAAAAPAVRPKATERAPERKEQEDDSKLTPLQRRLKGKVLISAKTNETTGVIEELYLCKDGTKHSRTIPPPPIFEHASDQIISMLVCRNPNSPIPPLPPMRPGDLDKSFVESLLSPIKVKSTDSAAVAAQKLAVMEMRSEISAAIKGGDTRGVAEILNDFVTDTNNRIRMKADALEMLNDVVKSDGEEAGKAFIDKVNEHFKSIGIDPIRKSNKNTESE